MEHQVLVGVNLNENSHGQVRDPSPCYCTLPNSESMEDCQTGLVKGPQDRDLEVAGFQAQVGPRREKEDSICYLANWDRSSQTGKR